MKRAHSTAGFTLLELAIVILIMGSMAAMIAPGLSEWMADARASAAAEDMLRLNRVVRSRVNQTGLAHLLVFCASDDKDCRFGLGRVQVWEGMNNRCNQTPWTQTIKGARDNVDGHQVIDEVDMGDSAYNLPMGKEAPRAVDSGRQVVRLMVLNADPKTAVLCFEPGGNTLTAVSDGDTGIGFRFIPQTEPVIFRVRRSISLSGGTPVKRGVDREIAFPAGGNARLII